MNILGHINHLGCTKLEGATYYNSRDVTNIASRTQAIEKMKDVNTS